jgi:hypothetical protein
MKTVQKIIEAYLKEQKLDGLRNRHTGCSCTLQHLMPCTHPHNCRPARAVPVGAEEGPWCEYRFEPAK